MHFASPRGAAAVRRRHPGMGCSVMTGFGDESTARQGHKLSFNVTVGVDPTTDTSAQAHANSLEWIVPRLGGTGIAQESVDPVSPGNE